jgi:hypothetical protein
MDKVTHILHKKTAKNVDLTPAITKKLLSIAENPQPNFRRYSIGFDANAMATLRRVLGYRWFNALIRRTVLKK